MVLRCSSKKRHKVTPVSLQDFDPNDQSATAQFIHLQPPQQLYHNNYTTKRWRDRHTDIQPLRLRERDSLNRAPGLDLNSLEYHFRSSFSRPACVDHQTICHNYYRISPTCPVLICDPTCFGAASAKFASY